MQDWWLDLAFPDEEWDQIDDLPEGFLKHKSFCFWTNAFSTRPDNSIVFATRGSWYSPRGRSIVELDLERPESTLKQHIFMHPADGLTCIPDNTLIVSCNDVLLQHGQEEEHIIAGIIDETGYRNGPALEALFDSPAGTYYDEIEHALYICDRGNHCIRKLDMKCRTVSTFAGSNEAGNMDGTLNNARFHAPSHITRHRTLRYFIISDPGNQNIRKISADGYVSTLSGFCLPEDSTIRDGKIQDATFEFPGSVAIDLDETIFVEDDHSIRRISATGHVCTMFHTPSVSISGLCIDHVRRRLYTCVNTYLVCKSIDTSHTTLHDCTSLRTDLSLLHQHHELSDVKIRNTIKTAPLI
eukprot:TRINITY_DN5129_c0_g1::TRINITY_DN5129_c0_g1_i1::g.29308::m.29308 TRINITY_DN5129_c0_g1::TRINITY_DN5129_c0_g1_i1::g.29308  ORF type:complete len:355 (-),score=-21.76,sp/Q8BZW8/NHLC2_MOUSE/24.18/1e-07,NHL/PF01436.16/2.2e+03,NHL/PF01436.16/0.00077,NHL/PF01436.16/24,NHL/PF01436.16/2.2e+03 TRINITY_DN5129_c0_g1_i1:9-1073(-)